MSKSCLKRADVILPNRNIHFADEPEIRVFDIELGDRYSGPKCLYPGGPDWKKWWTQMVWNSADEERVSALRALEDFVNAELLVEEKESRKCLTYDHEHS
jgi:hypothetical protein